MAFNHNCIHCSSMERMAKFSAFPSSCTSSFPSPLGFNSSAISEAFSQSKILPEVEKISPVLINTRRHLHRMPELHFREHKTSAFVAQKLKEYGIEVFEGIAQTGVVGVLHGTGAGEKTCIGLRADMDGLPVTEIESGHNKDYISEHKGSMHACGHDGHMTMLLGAAQLLSQSRNSFSGTVKFVFQPAEEAEGGALPMIQSGVLDGRIGPKVDQMYGAHLASIFPSGQIMVSHGPMMAEVATFIIDIKGEGGHGAMPSFTKDPIIVASYLVTQLQTIVSRNVDATDALVITVGTFQAGTKENIIPPTARLTGTIRTLDAKIKARVKHRLQTLLDGIAKAYEVEIKLEYIELYPATINDNPESVEAFKKVAAEIVGPQNVKSPKPNMGAEDFSYFLQHRPGAFFWVGAALPGAVRSHHSPEFDIDERSLLVGTSVWLQLVRRLMPAAQHPSKALSSNKVSFRSRL